MLQIEYDGTNYCGWQIQPNGNTVQAEITKAIKKLTAEDVVLNGAGRTDSKVHAREQVANFHTLTHIPPEGIARGLNTLLPEDIVIIGAREMPLEFHARYSAIGKQYSYHIYHNKYRTALYRNHSYHVSYPLQIDNMEKAAKMLIGRHDFKGFMTNKSSVKTTEREIYAIDFHKKQDSIWIVFRGNGFLYNMVRIIVGTLVEIGYGRKEVVDIQKPLILKDRTKAGHTAPPQGLYLDKVIYPLTH